MEDESEFLWLTQTSSRHYNETQSASFGEDVVNQYCGDEGRGGSKVVSLENNSDVGNFDVGWMYDSQPSTSCNSGPQILYDNVEIEDISNDDVVDSM